MNSRPQIVGDVGRTAREERIRRAFYREAELTLESPVYLEAFRAVSNGMLRQDTENGDLTVTALGTSPTKCAVEIRAKAPGILAGLAEAQWLYRRAGASVESHATDGQSLEGGDVLLQAAGDASSLLALERTIVNLLQRMSGIATATHKCVALARSAGPAVHIVSTRKTLLGLLDKRAVQCGGGGSHRLNLGEAVLIKTNHLRLALSNGKMDIEDAIRQAWERRKGARFFEVEAASPREAVRLAETLCHLQMSDANCPCILMLDNFSPSDATAALSALRAKGIHEIILVEASGNISEASIASYAAAGVDVISVGALTHSARALDLSAKLIPGM